jgi:hypothetical protein
MSKINAKSLATLRQKVRKYNFGFETEINAYREGPDPVGYSSGAAEEDDADLDIPEAAALVPAKKVLKQKAEKGAESGSESEEWASEEESESSESDLDIEGKEMEELRKYFLK